MGEDMGILKKTWTEVILQSKGFFPGEVHKTSRREGGKPVSPTEIKLGEEEMGTGKDTNIQEKIITAENTQWGEHTDPPGGTGTTSKEGILEQFQDPKEEKADQRN